MVKGVVSKGTQEVLNNLDQLPFGSPVNGGSGASDWKDKTSLGGKAKSWDITFTYNANGAIDKAEAATAK